jgi:hypothetical protein
MNAFLRPGYAPSCGLAIDRVTTITDPAPAPPREGWLPYKGRERVPTGGECVLTTSRGEVWLGTRLSTRHGLRLQLAGSFKILTVPHAEVVALRICPPHSFAERKAVIVRQRQGLPAIRLRQKGRTARG